MSELPVIYDFAQEYGVKLLVHYSAKDRFFSEQEKYIRRFLRVKGVSVYKRQFKIPITFCPALPYGALESKWQVLKNAFFEHLK